MNKKMKRAFRKWRYKLRSRLFHLYSLLKHRVRVWRLLNRRAINAFQAQKPTLDSVQQNILSDLQADGIAVTTLDELFPNENMLTELLAYVEKRKERARKNHKKPFLVDLIPEIPELGPEIPFYRIASHPYVVDVVNSYMGMQSVLLHFMLRRTMPSANNLPSHSQNWHRAPQEKMNCRMYIYLTDVDEHDGPFSYIPRSTFNKKWGKVARQAAITNPYITAEMIERHIPASEHQHVTGPKGTVIFCDTTGLHRGGYSQNGGRIMSTFGYGAPTLRENIHYSYIPKTRKALAPEYRHILNKKWLRDEVNRS